MQIRPLLYQGLSIAGVIPFALLTGLLFWPGLPGQLLQAGSLILIAYAGFIASFLAGTHWIGALAGGDKKRMSLIMAPSIISLLALFLHLVSPAIALLLSALLFPALFAGDKIWLRDAEPQPGYLRFRGIITAVVTALMILAALRLVMTG